MRDQNKFRPVRLASHSVVEVPLADRNGAALPLLFLDDGEVSIFAASYIRNLHFTGLSGSTIRKHVAAIGLMHDFYTIACGRPTLDQRGLQTFIKQFYEARRHGNKQLGWPAVKSETAENDLWYVSQFSLFCAENFGHVAGNPIETKLVSQLTSKEMQERMARIVARRKWDMLLHLFGATRESQGVEQGFAFKPKGGRRKRQGKVDHFPPTHLLQFIAGEPSIRNRLCWLLIFFGGLRISELCHIFVRDISFDHKTGQAKVILADPRDSTMNWFGSRGEKCNGTRAQFLVEKYGRIPRDELPPKHPEHAGWKSMAYESENKKEAEVIWLDPRVGEIFWKLHLTYMQTWRLQAGDKHPYYFISLRDDARGEPLKLKNLHNRFTENVKRVGLTPYRDGANPHAGRHFYGYYAATWLRMSRERVQKMMHHADAGSTDVYYRIDDAVVKSELEKAHALIANSLPAVLSTAALAFDTEKNDE